MWTKHLLAIILAVLFSYQSVCYAKNNDKSSEGSAWKSARKVASMVWPVFFGGGTFLFSKEGLDPHYPGYAFSGGLTFLVKEKNLIDTTDIFCFVDALYSFRDYEGFPNEGHADELHYKIEESSADLAVGIGFGNLYAGGYIQFPINTTIGVREWTMEDFKGLSRTTSFSFMGGMRATGKHLGIDIRLLLGQGPGQFLRKSLGEQWLGQISLGLMGRI